MSGIYIPSVGIPTEGFITVTITSDGRVVGNSQKINGKFEYLDNKDIASAIPVPDHGRLVDGDKIVEGCKDKEGRYFSQFAAAIGETVEAAPTIIPASKGEPE